MVALPAFVAIPHPEIDTLVAGAAAGDAACFDALYRRDSERVYNLVLRSCGDPDEAQDVCQEVWSRAHRSLGSLRDAGAFDAWVMRIAAHACIDASRRRRFEYDETTLIAIEGGRDASDEVEKREQRHLVWQALGALPQRQRVALYLREVEDMRYVDIAHTIGATPAAVETLLFRARHSLAQAYGRLADSPGERCQRARHLMAVVLDGEGDPAEQRSLKAHLGDCHACQRQLFTLNRGKRNYAALPFIAASGALAPVLLPAAGAGIGGAGALLGLARLGTLLSKGTSLAIPAVTAATLTVAGIVAGPSLQDILSGGQPAAPAFESTSPAITVTLSEPAPVSVVSADLMTQPVSLPPLHQALPVATIEVPQVPTTLAAEAPFVRPQAQFEAQEAPPALANLPPPVMPQLAQTPLPTLPLIPPLPRVTTQAVAIPPITLPALTIPGLTAPPVSTQPLTLPAVQLPPVAGLPNVTLPPVTVPPVRTPPISVPQVTAPQVTLPAVQLPLLPVVPLPGLNLPLAR